MKPGIITKVAGPLVIADGMRDANMFDVVRVSSQRLIGEIIDAIPISSKMLMILLPITLPSNISVLPEISDEIETANSGAPVPNATIVKPINCFDTLKFEATEDAPDTNQSAPLIKITNPNISSKTCKKVSISFIFYV